jgi:hypothetical protein
MEHDTRPSYYLYTLQLHTSSLEFNTQAHMIGWMNCKYFDSTVPTAVVNYSQLRTQVMKPCDCYETSLSDDHFIQSAGLLEADIL